MVTDGGNWKALYIESLAARISKAIDCEHFIVTSYTNHVHNLRTVNKYRFSIISKSNVSRQRLRAVELDFKCFFSF